MIVLAGGGTGGHIFPAIALADTIHKQNPEARVYFIGTEQGLEGKYVREAGYPLTAVPSRPVLGRSPLNILKACVSLVRGILQARRLLREWNTKLVIGVGGYASVPAVVAAVLSGIPSVLLEPNARPGRANRLLSHFAKALFVQFEEAYNYFPRQRTHLVGMPVRTLPEVGPRSSDGRLRILVLGGSQGARSINRAMTGALDELSVHDGFEITHQTGPADFEEVRSAYMEAGVEADVAPFYNDVLERLLSADLVVARAGASTIAELCVAGRASILVPYPHAADDHQLANARELEEAGAAVVVPDAELAQRLATEIRRLAKEPTRLQRMAEAAHRRARPDAAEQIWERCREWLF